MVEMEPIDRIGSGISALDGVLDLVCMASGGLNEVRADNLYSLLRLIHNELQTGLAGLQS